MSTGFVLVPKRLVAAIHAARARYHPYETGGFLVGLRRNLHIEVTGITQQAEGDIATRASFERAGAAHRERIYSAWRATNETETLIGDWHSHPYGSGEPSSTDRNAWRTLARCIRRPVLGLIDSGSTMPNLYLATDPQVPFVIELVLCEESPDHLAFA